MSDLLHELLAAADEPAIRDLIAGAEPAALDAAIEPLASEVLRRLRDDPHTALAAAELAGAIAATTDDARHRARATWVRGHALAGVLRNEEALACYKDAESAYTSLGDLLSATRTAVGQVNTLTYLGRNEEALEIGQRARQALMRLGQTRPATSLDLNLGKLHYRLEQHDEALRLHDRALGVARRLRDEVLACQIQFNRSQILISLGRLDHAERIISAVLDVAGREGDRYIVAIANYNLGYIYMLRGDFGRAYDTLDSARAEFEALGHEEMLGGILLRLTELLLEMNSFQRARTMGRRARAIAERLGTRFEFGQATLLLGMAAQGSGQDEEAEALLSEAMGIFRQDGHPVSAALCAVYLAESERRGGSRAAASRRLAQATEVFGQQGVRLQETMAHLRRAGVELERGHHTEAREALIAAGRLLRRLPSAWLLAQADHLNGRVALATGTPPQAIRHLRRAVERIESIRGRIGIDEFRISFAEDKAPIYADLVELILSRPRRGSVDEAFAIVERSRSRALVDLLAGRLTGPITASDARTSSLLDRLDKLRAEISWLSGFDHEGGSGQRDERRLHRLRPQIRAREAEIADVMHRLLHRNAAMGALTAGETVTLGEVQDALEPDTTLVEYFLSRDGARAFVITRGEARVVDLPLDIKHAARHMARLRFQIEKWGYGDNYVRARERVLREALDRHLSMLGNHLWEPLGLDGGRVIVVPHGPLHSVPFNALRLAGGESLIDRFLITHLPSASAQRYLRTRRRSGGTRPRREPYALAVGVADESIPHVEQEIDLVRRFFPRGQALLGKRADRQRFLAAAAEADIIHIASHGLFREDDPHFSALKLADGWMSLYDVYGLRTSAALICLSSCQSGRSWVSQGDELVGLIRGFLYAGAAALVVSLWPVQDASTAELMGGFYRRLRAGQEGDEALREAMLELRETMAHPYHWAPFVMIGRQSIDFSASQ